MAKIILGPLNIFQECTSQILKLSAWTHRSKKKKKKKKIGIKSVKSESRIFANMFF